MPYLTAHNAIIDCGNAIISFPDKGVTLTCKKASNARFSAMAKPDTPDFISEFPDVFPAKKITELWPLRQINHDNNLHDAKSASSTKDVHSSRKDLTTISRYYQRLEVEESFLPMPSQ